MTSDPRTGTVPAGWAARPECWRLRVRRFLAWLLAGLGIAALAYVFVVVAGFAVLVLRVLSIG